MQINRCADCSAMREEADTGMDFGWGGRDLA